MAKFVKENEELSEDEKIKQAIRDMADVFGRKMTDSAVEWWARMWQPYDYSRLEIAMHTVASSSSYMPTIHQLKAAVSHLCPTKLAQRVLDSWHRSGNKGIPTQQDIDNILRGFNEEPGTVTRKLLVPKFNATQR